LGRFERQASWHLTRQHARRPRQKLDGRKEEIRPRHVFGHGERKAIVEVGVTLALRFGELLVPPLYARRVAHRSGWWEVEEY
jgi:hypothetical protein